MTLDKETKIKRAKAIINEAKNYEVYNDPVDYGNEDALFALSEELEISAREAFDRGKRGAAVTSILFAADVDWASSSKQPEEDEENVYKKFIEAEIEHLPIPPDPGGDLPTIPANISELSDRELRNYYGIAGAISARAAWLYAVEDAGKTASKHIADDIYETWLITAVKKDPETKKAKTSEALKAEARRDNPDLKSWRDRQTGHTILANKYRRLRDLYNNHCDRISREWTMRTQEKEHSA